VAHCILNSRRDAEDLVHDVFLEAWQKASHYNPRRGTVRNWLLMRVRSRAIDRIRTQGVARNHAMAEHHYITENTVSCNKGPENNVDVYRALEVLGGLSAEQRRIVELSYFEGLTCKEIATQCAIPVGTVKSRMSAAMAKLRGCLAKAVKVA